MITRRNALKLGAAGVALSSIGAAQDVSGTAQTVGTPVASPEAAQLPPAIGPSLDSPIVVKWRYEPGSTRGSSPMIVDNMAYGTYGFAPDSFAYALDAESGIEIWRHDHDVSYSQPVIEAGIAIFASSTNSVLALDAATGTEIWRYDTGSVPLQPFAANGTIYCGVENGELYALDTATGVEKWVTYISPTYSSNTVGVTELNSSVIVAMGSPVLYSLDKETGTQKWSFITQGYSLNTPIANEHVVYFASGEGLHALDSQTGSEIWHFAAESPRSSGPILNEGVLYWGMESGPLRAIDAETGQLIWELLLGEYGATDIGVGESTVTFSVATGGQMFPYYNLHGVDRLTGAPLWRSEDIWNIMLPASASDGTLVVSEYHARATDQEHGLYALDTSTGTELWRLSKPGGFPSRASIANGNIYVSSETGTIYCLGNLVPAVLLTDVTLRGAPSSTAIERSTAKAGDEITNIGARDSRAGQDWVEVTIGSAVGWIPLDAIDPASIPPEGEVEYVYIPN